MIRPILSLSLSMTPGSTSDLWKEHRTFLERVWRERPFLPRAIAAIMYFADCEDAVSEAVGANELELAAEILAESQIGKNAFYEEYGIAWNVATEAFEAAMSYCGRNSSWTPGEGIVYAGLPRLLYRLGYSDGRAGAIHAPPPPPSLTLESLREPEPTEPEAQRYVDGIRRRNDRIFRVAYDQGHAHGFAERFLEENAAHILDRIDELVLQFEQKADPRRGDRARLTKALRKFIRYEVMEQYAPEVLDYTWTYAVASEREFARRMARRALLDHLKDEGPLTPLSMGAIVRTLARARRRAATPKEQQAYTEQYKEAVLLFATSGYLPDALSALIADPATTPYLSVGDVIATCERDYDVASRTRQILRALGNPPPLGRLRPDVIEGLPPYVLIDSAHGNDCAASVRTEDDITRIERVVTDKVEPMTEHERTLRDDAVCALKCEELLRTEYLNVQIRSPELQLAPMLIAGRVNAELSNVSVCASTGALGSYLRFEQMASENHTGVRSQLAIRGAVFWGKCTLEEGDPSAYRRIQGECEIVRRGGVREIATAERWAAVYRREAEQLGLNATTLGNWMEIDYDSDIVEGAYLLARARLIEDALETRAAAEARVLFVKHVAGAGFNIYTAPNAEKLLAEIAAAGTVRILAEVHRDYDHCRDFAMRLERHVHLEALDWLVREIQVLAEVASHVSSPVGDVL